MTNLLTAKFITVSDTLAEAKSRFPGYSSRVQIDEMYKLYVIVVQTLTRYDHHPDDVEKARIKLGNIALLRGGLDSCRN